MAAPPLSRALDFDLPRISRLDSAPSLSRPGSADRTRRIDSLYTVQSLTTVVPTDSPSLRTPDVTFTPRRPSPRLPRFGFIGAVSSSGQSRRDGYSGGRELPAPPSRVRRRRGTVPARGRPALVTRGLLIAADSHEQGTASLGLDVGRSPTERQELVRSHRKVRRVSQSASMAAGRKSFLHASRR